MEHYGDLTLALNAGSSSLKISIFAAQDVQKPTEEPVSLVLTASISSISSPPARFSLARLSIKDQAVDSITDHASAFAHFLEVIKRKGGVDRSRIARVCHRVVHGGDHADPVVIDDESYHRIEALSHLAPLHNHAALSCISACFKVLPHAKSIAYFDTAFHRTIPPHVSAYAIDQSIAERKNLKKYGFHGLSYSYILRAVAKFLQKPANSLNLIVLHLGSGASACAIQQGRSLDTSMGLTPLSGLPGATRSGSVDPCLIFHYASSSLSSSEAEETLNARAGWRAMTGTGDFAAVVKRAGEGDAAARLALDLFVDRVLGYIGAYHIKLGGAVDALVFSGGIGEKSAEVRGIVGRAVGCLGFVDVDEEANRRAGDAPGTVVDFGVGEGGKRVLMCRTNEQLEMARQCRLDKNFWPA